MKNLSRVTTLIVGLFFMIPGVHALPIVVYDFFGPPAVNTHAIPVGVLGPSYDVTADGLTVTVIGKDFNTAVGPSANLNRAAGGFGVEDAQGAARVGADEAIELSFAPRRVLGLAALIFEVGSLQGNLDLYVDGAFVETIDWLIGGGNFAEHDFSAANYRGSSFEFRGTGNGNFRVAGIAVGILPEPSMILLCLTGAFVLVGMSRRRAIEFKTLK